MVSQLDQAFLLKASELPPLVPPMPPKPESLANFSHSSWHAGPAPGNGKSPACYHHRRTHLFLWLLPDFQLGWECPFII